MTYYLTAVLGTRRRRRTIQAEDSLEATIASIAKILNLAHDEPDGPWAKGRVQLHTGDGRLLHEMEAKPLEGAPRD